MKKEEPVDKSRDLLPIVLAAVVVVLAAVAGIYGAKVIGSSTPEGEPPVPGLKIEHLAPERPFVIDREVFATASETVELIREMKVLLKQFKERSIDGEGTRRFRELSRILKERSENLKQGISLKVRFTNHLDEGLTLFFGADASKNFLMVDGPGAAQFPDFSMMRTDERRHPGAHRLEPGDHKDFTINELRFGERDLERWLITDPGRYAVTLRYVTHKILKGKRVLAVDEVTNTVVFEVEEKK